MKKKIFYSTVAALLLLPAAALAEEAGEKMKTLDEVVVTATRSAKKTSAVAADVTVITAEEIADSGAANIADVLEKQANILINTYSGNVSQASIDLRGFGGETGHGRTLVLLDGRRLNRPDMPSINWAQIPLEQIERIEVVRGSNSVLYGNGAVAGVVHIITKKGAVKPSITGSLQVGEDNFHSESAGITGSANKLSYAVNISNQETDGWRERTGFHSFGGGVQLGYDASDSLGLSGGISYNRTDFEMPNALTRLELAVDRTQSGYDSDESENEDQNANLRLESFFGDLGDLELSLVYGTSENRSTRYSWWSFGTYEIDSIGIQPKYVLSTDFGVFSNQLTTGVDIYYEDLTVDLFATAAMLNKSRTTEIERDTLGWYIRDEVSFGPTFILSGGARIERSETSVRLNDLVTPANSFTDEKEHDGEVFEFSAVWLPLDSLKLYARFATVYRYPFVDEQANYSGWGTDDLYEDIEAEEGKNYEAGIEIFPVDNFSAGVNFYLIDMEDEINYNPVTWRNENLDDTRRRGVELSVDYELDGVADLQLNYTYQESSFEGGPNKGNEVPLVPNNLVSATVNLSLPFDLHLVPTLTYVDESYLSGDYDNNTEKLDDYTVVGLQLRYKKNFDSGFQLTAFVGASNMFDEEYSTWGMDQDQYDFPPFFDFDNLFYPSPGRKFYGGISGTF